MGTAHRAGVLTIAAIALKTRWVFGLTLGPNKRKISPSGHPYREKKKLVKRERISAVLFEARKKQNLD
jgi:hypothetical protein